MTTTVRLTEPDGSSCLRCVLLAVTTDEHQRGLMGVTSLGGYDGMAFRYETPSSSDYWMKDTVMPLSIGFYASDGRVVGHLRHGSLRGRSVRRRYGPAEPFTRGGRGRAGPPRRTRLHRHRPTRAARDPVRPASSERAEPELVADRRSSRRGVSTGGRWPPTAPASRPVLASHMAWNHGTASARDTGALDESPAVRRGRVERDRRDLGGPPGRDVGDGTEVADQGVEVESPRRRPGAPVRRTRSRVATTRARAGPATRPSAVLDRAMAVETARSWW